MPADLTELRDSPGWVEVGGGAAVWLTIEATVDRAVILTKLEAPPRGGAASGAPGDVTWRIDVHWLCHGRSGVVIADDEGHPFRLVTRERDL